MKRRIMALLVVALILTLLTASLASADPGAPGTPTVRWVTLSATVAELRADGLTDGGTPGNVRFLGTSSFGSLPMLRRSSIKTTTPTR